MDFRARRQLAVILIAGAIAFAVGIGIYNRFAPQPTCFDNRRNQGEEETDCGGPCVSCVFKHQKGVEVFWTRFVKVRENTYDVAAEIRNSNVKLGLASFDYGFKLFDALGVLVAERRGASFIYPGETMHLAEIGLLSGRSVRRAELTIKNERWVLAEIAPPDVIAGGREYNVNEDNGIGHSALKAVISNRTIVDIPDLSVSAIVFDHDGNLLGLNRTLIQKLPAGASQPVTFTWPDVFPRDVSSSTVIEARSRILLPAAQP